MMNVEVNGNFIFVLLNYVNIVLLIFLLCLEMIV